MAEKLCLPLLYHETERERNVLPLFGRAPDLADFIDGRLAGLGVQRVGFEELNPGQNPGRHVGLDQTVEDMSAFTALGDDAVHTEDGEILRGAGVADPEHRLQCVDIAFSFAEFFHDADAIRMRENSEEFSEFFGDYVTSWHENIKVCTCAHIL
jgi:hypothetical protein